MDHGFQTINCIDIIGDTIDPVNETLVLKGVHILKDKPAQHTKADDSGLPLQEIRPEEID
ncbi:MAG: hypothetical protein EXR21_10510 [Flavobacteriaceae bacterium]|nr:hypothetical protein [Flavobacteriaceae bacterium]